MIELDYVQNKCQNKKHGKDLFSFRFKKKPPEKHQVHYFVIRNIYINSVSCNYKNWAELKNEEPLKIKKFLDFRIVS